MIDQAGPFLQAQIRAGGDIKSLADGLARFTWQLRAADLRLRDTLADALMRLTRPTPRSPDHPVSALYSPANRAGWEVDHHSRSPALVVFLAVRRVITPGGRRTLVTRAP